MALTVQDVIDSARTTLMDPLGVRWTDAELISYLNGAALQAVLLKPDCNPSTVPFTCVAGVEQNFSQIGGVGGPQVAALLDVVSCMGSVEVEPEQFEDRHYPVTYIKRNVLDMERQGWRDDTQRPMITYYMYKPKQRDIFYVYPPAVVDTEIEIVVSLTPTLVSVVGDNIALQDIYFPSLVNYVLWKAFSKDSDFSGNMNLASGYYGAFVQGLTGKLAAENVEFPDRNIPPQVIEAID